MAPEDTFDATQSDPEAGTADEQQQVPAPDADEGTTGNEGDSAKFFQRKYQETAEKVRELEKQVAELSTQNATFEKLLGSMEEIERDMQAARQGAEQPMEQAQGQAQQAQYAVDWKSWAHNAADQAWKSGDLRLLQDLFKRFPGELADSPYAALMAQRAQQQSAAQQGQQQNAPQLDPLNVVMQLRKVEQRVGELATFYGQEFLQQEVTHNGEPMTRAEAITREAVARGEQPNVVALQMFPNEAQKALIENARRTATSGVAGPIPPGAPSPGGPPQGGQDALDAFLSDDALSTKPPEGAEESREIFLGGGGM